MVFSGMSWLGHSGDKGDEIDASHTRSILGTNPHPGFGAADFRKHHMGAKQGLGGDSPRFSC